MFSAMWLDQFIKYFQHIIFDCLSHTYRYKWCCTLIYFLSIIQRKPPHKLNTAINYLSLPFIISNRTCFIQIFSSALWSDITSPHYGYVYIWHFTNTKQSLISNQTAILHQLWDIKGSRPQGYKATSYWQPDFFFFQSIYLK